MTDPYDHDERLAIQACDGIYPSDDKPKADVTIPCPAIQKLMAHRERVLADRAAKHVKKYGADRKILSGGN